MNNYIIKGVRGFDLNTYLKAMKVRYELFELFLRENQAHWEMDPNKDMIQEEWDRIKPLTVNQAFHEQNQEKRRALFSCLGPSRLFKELKCKLVDRTVLTIPNKTWDLDGREATTQIEDVYELYEIDEDKLFPETGMVTTANRRPPVLRVVRCWCTTTGREYWIFVQDDAARGFPYWNSRYREPMKNAIEAISWTFRVGIDKEDIESLYRQGDCLVIKAKPYAKVLPEDKWYHLDEHTYREKLVAQS